MWTGCTGWLCPHCVRFWTGFDKINFAESVFVSTLVNAELILELNLTLACPCYNGTRIKITPQPWWCEKLPGTRHYGKKWLETAMSATSANFDFWQVLQCLFCVMFHEKWRQETKRKKARLQHLQSCPISVNNFVSSASPHISRHLEKRYKNWQDTLLTDYVEPTLWLHGLVHTKCCHCWPFLHMHRLGQAESILVQFPVHTASQVQFCRIRLVKTSSKTRLAKPV